MEQKEATLVARLKDERTRRGAFGDLVATYGQKLYWQIRRVVTYHDDADDVLQNTFIKAWNALSTFRGDSKIQTWLFKIAYNESVTFLNSRRNTVSIDAALSPEGDEDDHVQTMADTLMADEYFDGDATEALLQAAIDTLPAKQKAVFMMRYYDELPYEDMAEITGTSTGALKASYHIASKKITDYFDRHD